MEEWEYHSEYEVEPADLDSFKEYLYDLRKRRVEDDGRERSD
jgi:hypothetical protein